MITIVGHVAFGATLGAQLPPYDAAVSTPFDGSESTSGGLSTIMPLDRSVSANVAIAVMAKASKPGRTKTRLSGAIGAANAARLNTAFLHDIAENLAAAGRTAPIAGYMAFGPPGEHAFFDFLPPGIGLFEAWQPNFGDTLKGAIGHMLEMGHSAACVLNADSPTLPTAILVDMARLLSEPGDNIVLGPSTDGGYYLLGMKTLHARLFEEITWSTETVAAETLERAKEIGVGVRLLPEWYDVDDAASLEVLRGELFRNEMFGSSALVPAPARHTGALLSEIDRAKASTTRTPA